MRYGRCSRRLPGGILIGRSVFPKRKRSAVLVFAPRQGRRSMNKYVTALGLGVLALTALVMHTSTAVAGTVHFKSSFNALASVPPPHSNGTRNPQATYFTTTKQLTYTVPYFRFTCNATAAHF